MRFEFATATRILFGAGQSRELAPAAARMGRRALVVTGSSPGRAEPFVASLKTAGVDCVSYSITGEPTIESIRRGAAMARAEACDMVISIGGGSVIDGGKALAAMVTNAGDPLDYLEVVGRGQPLDRPSAPFIAVPTTAGTGSEVTRNAVLASPEHRVKASLRSPWMLPRLAIVDPELTLGLPASVTASTGLDALTQVIEPYVSVRANPMTDLFCEEGIRRATHALPRAWENGQDAEARAGMAWVSLLGGLSLANAGLGAVHGFAAPVGGMFPAPHGAVCAALLPHVMSANVRALRSRQPGARALERYAGIARLLTGNPGAAPEDGIAWVASLCARLEVPPLGRYGVKPQDAEPLVENAARASSMKGNPIELTREELMNIVCAAI